jgi:hypothetical protein
MTAKEIQETQDKSIKKVPVILWARFVGACKTDQKTVTEGIIEAINLWLGQREC